MTARDTSESQALEDTDPINLFHCPRCGTSQTFLSLEALNSHIESIHICSLPSKVSLCLVMGCSAAGVAVPGFIIDYREDTAAI